MRRPAGSEWIPEMAGTLGQYAPRTRSWPTADRVPYNPAMPRVGAMAQITVIIPNYNGARHLQPCLASLARQTRPPEEVIVVDNGSADASREVLRAVAPEAVWLPQGRNLGFAAAVNAGVRAARGDWVAVLNNDTEVADGWLDGCVAGMKRHPEAAFLACRVLDHQ